MSQRWSNMRQLNNDLPDGLRAEKEGYGCVRVSIYDDNDNLHIQEQTGHTLENAYIEHRKQDVWYQFHHYETRQ